MSVYPQPITGSYDALRQPPVGYASQHVMPHGAPKPDRDLFRRDYTQRLAELTVNSLPIIKYLSILAQNYSGFADVVAECIEAHIRTVKPWFKLPAFYLLDAISKNVFEPYARYFASFVTPLFLQAYRDVDEHTRGKMEEMLLTWRTGSPIGDELFGKKTQLSIERGIWGTGTEGLLSNNGLSSASGSITKSQVLSELQFTLGLKVRALQVNPYDVVSQNHLTVLQQLRQLVEAGVSQEELQQILIHLRTLARSSVSQAVPAPPQVVQSQWTTPAHVPPVQSDNITSLLSTLIKAGIVSVPVATTEAAKSEESKPIIKPQGVERREASREYSRAVLLPKIQLTSTGIMRTQPRVVALLYDRLTLQCKQCGIRFTDAPHGKKRLEDHLDMHFRQNRKASQNVGRGHSRSWFVGLEDWIHDVSKDNKKIGGTDVSARLNSSSFVAADLAKREAELRSQFVVVPPGDEAKSISCPICKETLKSEFVEDDEDWVWKNTVKKDDRVYHATCHAEALVSTSSLAARLRSEFVEDSRGSTPESQVSTPLAVLRSTPPPQPLRNMSTASEFENVGLKRKMKSVADLPPLKRLATSS